MKIYVPDLNYKCYVLTNKDTIRAYEVKPYNPGYNQNITINYRDYYINSNYYYTDGTQQFGNYTTLPICLDSSVLTNDVYYRLDLDKILVIFMVLVIICIIFPLKVFGRFYKRSKL